MCTYLWMSPYYISTPPKQRPRSSIYCPSDIYLGNAPALYPKMYVVLPAAGVANPNVQYKDVDVKFTGNSGDAYIMYHFMAPLVPGHQKPVVSSIADREVQTRCLSLCLNSLAPFVNGLLCSDIFLSTMGQL